jgi:GT2 family glycosyltransferase
MIPVIIPFYKNKTQLDKCLMHLRQQSMPVQVFIRDNSEDNIFFTAAVNEGIRYYLDKPVNYMIILNQDMYLDPRAVEEMVNFMNRNPSCGIGAPLQLHPQQTDYVIWAGCYEAFPVGRHLHGPLQHFKTDEPIYWANGACMIFRKQMIQEIGIMDKNLVFIGSDSDYSFTARSRGWEIWRIATATGVHEQGASGNSGNPNIELLKINDMLYFSRKWLNSDLYNSLAFEGRELTFEKINEHIHRLEYAKILVSNELLTVDSSSPSSRPVSPAGAETTK